MTDKTVDVKKSIGKPLFGSQEAPLRESTSAPANTDAKITTGKPRPPSSD